MGAREREKQRERETEHSRPVHLSAHDQGQSVGCADAVEISNCRRLFRAAAEAGLSKAFDSSTRV